MSKAAYDVSAHCRIYKLVCFEWTILPKLPMVFLYDAYLTELVSPHTVPSLGDRHFKEYITNRQKFPDLSPLTGMRTTTKDTFIGL